MSRDSFGSFSSPMNPLVPSPQRDSFGSFQEYKVESIQDSDKEPSLGILEEECPFDKVEKTTLQSSPKDSLSIKSLQTNSLAVEISCFTDENVFYQLCGSDPVLDALKKCFTFEEMVGMNSRTLMTVDEARKSGKDVLEILTSNQSWFAITQYTRTALVSCSHDQIDEIMKLWNLRLLALYQLNEYDALEFEFSKLGDLNRSSLYYEHYKDSSRSGPIVLYEISLLYCLVPILKQNYTETIERLYGLLYSLKHKDKTCQILIHVANTLLKMEDYYLGQEVLDSISKTMDEDDPEKLQLDSIRARIYLQLGDLETASTLFDNISEKSKPGENSRLLNVNQALLAISKGDWEIASNHFSKILESNPKDWIICNNKSIIELYKGQVSEALKGLDTLLINNPKEMARSPEAIFNLCTVYDLLDQSLERKKKALESVISPFAGDDFQIGSLKL